MTGALLWVISDIHRVCTNTEDPMDVKNNSQPSTCSQAVCSSNFQMWNWGVILFLFEKTWPVSALKTIQILYCVVSCISAQTRKSVCFVQNVAKTKVAIFFVCICFNYMLEMSNEYKLTIFCILIAIFGGLCQLSS